MKVLKIIDKSIAKQIDFFQKNRDQMLFIFDGNGDLIVGKQVIDYLAFTEIKDRLLSGSIEIDYVELTEAKQELLKTEISNDPLFKYAKLEK